MGIADFLTAYISKLPESSLAIPGKRGFWEWFGQETGVPAQRWRSVVTGRQGVTHEMTDALLMHVPGFADALSRYANTVGRRQQPADTASLIRARLEEIRARDGRNAWEGLEQRTGVSARKWKNVHLKTQQPTFELLDALMLHDPDFARKVQAQAGGMALR